MVRASATHGRLASTRALAASLPSGRAGAALVDEPAGGLGGDPCIAAIGVGADGRAELLVERRATDQHDVVVPDPPVACSVWMTTFMYGMVVVSSADMPRMSGLWSSSAAMNFSASVLIPRSTTSKPAPSSIIPTRFLPMSWMSPLTVPMTTLPTGSAPVSARSGRRIAIPAFIAFAASRTSGTNRIPSRKSIADDLHAGDQGVVEDAGGRPAAAEQDVGALDDLGRHPVVEVVVHLLGELVVGQRGEVDLRVLVLAHRRISSAVGGGVDTFPATGFHDVELCRMMEPRTEPESSPAGAGCPESSPSSGPSPCLARLPTARSA